MASQLTEEVTAHVQSDSLEDAREICADGTYFPNNLRIINENREVCVTLSICQTIWGYLQLYFSFSSLWHCGQTRAMVTSFLRFLDHTQRSITVGRTSLDEWSARRRPDYTQHSTQTDIRAPGGIRTHNPSKRAAADPRLRRRGHWDRPAALILVKNNNVRWQQKKWHWKFCFYRYIAISPDSNIFIFYSIKLYFHEYSRY